MESSSFSLPIFCWGELLMSAKLELYSHTKPDGTVIYGYHIGINSDDEFIIAVKDSNEILVFPATELTKTLPGTV
jgi:hypothetical protein